MRILATGGAGYIGSHVVHRLLQQGHEVLIFDNLSTGHRAAVEQLKTLAPSHLSFHQSDLADPEAVQRSMSEFAPDTVMHFAGILDVAGSMELPLKYYRTNVINTVNLLQGMADAGCHRLIFSSTCATYGQPDEVPIREETPQRPVNPYGRSKWVVEGMLGDCARAWGLGSVALRYFNVAGCSFDGLIGENHEPEVHLIPRVLMAVTGELAELNLCGTDYDTPDGTCIRDYLHVEDVAEAHVLCLGGIEAGTFRPYNLGTGRGQSVREVIAAVEKVTGRRCPVKETARRPGDPARLVANADLIGNTLGWQLGRSSMENIIESAWRWYHKSSDRLLEKSASERYTAVVQISYIIVNYNTRELTLKSLAHIFADLDDTTQAEIIVVDNASTDDSCAAVAVAFPQVKLVKSPRNVGFGAGNNLGMAAAQGEVLALINSDAFIARGFTRTMLHALERYPQVGMLGPRLVYEDGRTQVSCFCFPTPRYAWLENLGIAGLLPAGSRFGNYQRWAHDAPRSVDFVSGACMVLRAEVYRQTGGFDENFFMYSEESDWQLRTRQYGWDIRFVPDTVVVHVAGGSNQAPSHQLNPQFFTSLDYYQRKNHGLGGWLSYKLACVTGVLVRAPLWLVGSLFRPAHRARLRFSTAVLWWHLSHWD